MPERKLVIAAYDVASSARRLKRALKHCTSFATGGQKSVHECWVTKGEQSSLSDGLGRICGGASDVWLIADLGAKPRVMTLGLGRAAPKPRGVLFLG